MKKSLLVVSLLLLPVLVLAVHYGRYNCDDCLLPAGVPDIDTTLFITTVVNQDVNIWRAGDTVKICNATTCVTYTYQANGTHVATSFAPNSGFGGGFGGGGGGGFGGGGSGGGFYWSTTCGYVNGVLDSCITEFIHY